MTIGDDEELFNAAMSGEPAKEPEPAPEPSPEPQPVAEGEEQPRDPTGKFAKKTAEPAPSIEAQTEAQEEPEPRQDHRIPLAEHLSVRERAQRAEQERDQERQNREALQRQFDAMQRQIEQLRKPQGEPVDVWSDPQAFINQQLDPIRSGQEAVLERISRAMAVDKFGQEAVSTAMTELERQMQMNPAARFEHQRIMASDHPYGELVAWHKRQAALKEVGDDPNAYKARILEEAKKDPAFVASIVEAARAQAQQPAANGTRSPTAVNLPPSLNRTTGSGGQAPSGAPKSDAEIFAGLFP